MSLLTEVRRSVQALEPGDRDAAAAELALTYAQTIAADPDMLAKLGPALLTCLESLGLTRRAAVALAKGGTSSGPTASPVDDLRARREARKHAAQARDASAS